MSGSLDSLRRRHAAFTARFNVSRGKRVFSQPPTALMRRIGYDAASRRHVFALRDDDGAFAAQPLASAAPLTAALRDAAVARMAGALPDQAAAVRRLLGGEGAGPADKARRLRLTPLPSIGHAEACASIRRLAVEVPADCPLRADSVAWGFSGLAPFDPDTGQATAPWRLSAFDDDTMPPAYAGRAAAWRTVTVAALPGACRRRIDPDDRAGKGGTERRLEEERAMTAVRVALRHAGVTARPIDIIVQREPFGPRGARAEAFAAGARFARHVLWHAAVRFATPVAGPLLIGDGRFCGLGLMEPDRPRRIDGALGFAFRTPPRRTAPSLAEDLRRAVMARVRDATGSESLAPFVTGHAADGAPLRGGGRARIACLADPDGARLLVLAPWRLDRRDPTDTEREHWETLRDALRGFDTLRSRAGPPLALRGGNPATDDLLFAEAAVWQSRTPWRANRHPRDGDAAAHAAQDVAQDCRRRGLPTPAVCVIDLRQGPRGGLSALLRLSFPRRVAGPILLGRDAQTGGGLFGPADG